MILPLFVLVGPACGSGDGSAPDAASHAIDPDPHFERHAASLWIVERSPIAGGPTAFSSVSGSVATGAQPQVHREVLREGSCRLLAWDAPLCDPPCAGAACVATDTCEPYPEPLSAGRVTVAGLARPLTVEPDPLGGYGFHADGDLFEPGTAITVSAPGDDVPAFELAASAPAADNLAVSFAAGDSGPDFQPDAPFEFTWTGADPGSRVRLRMAADAAHGQPYAAVVECDAPDTGSLVVPGAIVTGFIHPDNWSCGECPTQTLTRYRASRVDIGSGRTFELVVGNQVTFFYFGYPGR